ncbi:hypothetical protein MBAV_005724 [Candidatus Magnetobacterium bavaricum]|uniref:Uncharacterized protein n=1 Tax=Candidatus Magnetobacterium bavaricum TaxID=29290 RepID=A0A0F3GJC8_9BACT|nr:hypothetical protein MBAV_005724 [Candidatus Magnetobacterium bavaricum]
MITEKNFKLITFLENIYYYPRLDNVFKTANCLLDKNGYIFIKTLSGDSPCFWWNTSRIERYNVSASCMPTLSSLKYMLKNSGFEVIASKCYPYYNILSMIGLTKNRWLNKVSRVFNPIFNLLHLSDRVMIICKKVKDI